MIAALPWHINALKVWQQEAGRHHAWLLVGNAGSGTQALALALAQTWLCTASRDGQACGECESCQWWAAGVHPDLRVIAPEEPEAGAETQARREIKVDAIRALGEWAATTAHRHAKVVVIDPADTMNVQAANALLKLLEEPPTAVRFVLTASDARRLPATIVSRCLKRNAPIPDKTTALTWMRAQGAADNADVLLAQAGGAPISALALGEAGHRQARQRFLDALAKPRELSALVEGDALDAVTRSERRSALGARLDWMISWVHDGATVMAGGVPRYNPDFHSQLENVVKPLPSLPWIRYYANLIEARRVLQHPLTPRLVLEDLLIRYKAIATATNTPG